jgi:hypothetical protein
MESARTKIMKGSREARVFVREVKKNLEALKKLLDKFTIVVKNPIANDQGIPVIYFQPQTHTSTKPQLKVCASSHGL